MNDKVGCPPQLVKLIGQYTELVLNSGDDEDYHFVTLIIPTSGEVRQLSVASNLGSDDFKRFLHRVIECSIKMEIGNDA